MSKSSRNFGAVLAVLFLALLVVGLIFVVKVAYYDEPKLTEQLMTDVTDETSPSETETEAPKDVRIAVFQTSDINGYIMDTTGGEEKTFQYRLARIAKFVDNARESDDFDDVVLVDGGDIYQGAPVSNLTEGAALRAALDVMGYDAVTLGNHEFDWDITTYATDTMATVPAYEVGEFSGDPAIPVLAATLYSSNNHNRSLFTKDYVIVEKAGYRIALIGYIPDYSEEILQSKIEPYELHGDLGEFSDRVKEINESEKPDVTIVIAHDDPVAVSKALDHEDVDLVTGGLDNDGIFGVSDNGIPFIQAARNAEGYASAVIVIDPEGNVTVEDTMCTSIMEEPELLYDNMSNSGNFNGRVLALSHAAWDAVSEEMNEALGYIDSSVEKYGFVNGKTTTGGNFITGLMLEATKGEGVVAAFYYRDGVYADFTVPEGEILELSVSDIYSLNPYNDRWLIYDLTGREIAKLLSDGIENSDFGDQVSGLTFEYNNRGTDEAPNIEIVSITMDNGTSIDVDGTDTKYRVVVPNYCASQSGSVFEFKKPLHPVLEAPVDNQSLIALLRDRRDKGQVHIPTDNKPKGKCLNANEVQTEETQASESQTTESQTSETTQQST